MTSSHKQPHLESHPCCFSNQLFCIRQIEMLENHAHELQKERSNLPFNCVFNYAIEFPARAQGHRGLHAQPLRPPLGHCRRHTSYGSSCFVEGLLSQPQLDHIQRILQPVVRTESPKVLSRQIKSRNHGPPAQCVLVCVHHRCGLRAFRQLRTAL